MTPPQFFTAPADLDERGAVLRGEEAAHAARVLRLEPGERVVIADGAGRVADAHLTAVSLREVRAEVERLVVQERSRPAITAVIGLLKSGKLDLVVQKLTELGVEQIAPVACRRSVVRLDARRAAVAQQRWTAIALAAAKQAHRALVPEILPVAPLTRYVGSATGPVLVCWESSRRRLADALPDEPPPRLTVVVGPEGGLEADEVAACREVGAQDVSLGRLVLRAETAVIAAVSAVAFRYGLLG